MAPSPEHDKEPKAPDKSHSQISDNSSSDIQVPVVESQQYLDTNSGATGGHTDPEESGQLESLDEGQLRALLDEAVTYKRPKDREGKSSLFKELLQEVEQDTEHECVWGSQAAQRQRRRAGGAGPGRRGAGSRPLLAHSGSLQDLAAEGAGQGGAAGGAGRAQGQARHAGRRPRAGPVSARSQQGGSLPANVDQHNFGVVEGRRSFLEDVRCGGGGGGGDYIATVRCVNPPPLGERPADYMLLELGPLGRRAASPPTRYYTTEDLDIRSPDTSGSRISVNYTSSATLEIGSPPPRDLSPPAPTCLLQPEDGLPAAEVPTLPPTSITTQAVSAAVTAVTSSTPLPITTASAAPQHLSFLNIKSCNMLPRLSLQAGKHDGNDFKKSLDENGNSVQTVNPSLGSSSQHSKKSKRKQKCKNETETLSNEIDGYRGSEKLDDIIKYIESNAPDSSKHKAHAKVNSSGINGKLSTSRDGKIRDDNGHEKGGKKRSTERRIKDCKMDKLKKSNSMEELSRSKLDDLTSGPSKDSLSLRKTKKQSTFDHSDIVDSKRSDRRSWGNDGSDTYYLHENNIGQDADDSFSANLSNSSSAQSSVTGQTVKPKKPKSAKTPDTESTDTVIEITQETSDFQTVTNKKKIRKRHSPCDEARGRSNNSYSHNNYGSKHGGRFNNGFTLNDRDAIYKRIGRSGSAERRHTSTSSPPSDKSNDSNDDLDSVHSLPAEASGERLQASYADMARAAVASTPIRPLPALSPPPPAVVVVQQQTPPPPARHHNVPDLIESCNYYSNERPAPDKYLDVSTENTKNLLIKDTTQMDANRSKMMKSNIADAGTQVEQSPPHPIYNHEQYPALEPRAQRLSDKNNLKNKVESKVTNSVNKNNSQVALGDKKQLIKSNSLKSCEDDDYSMPTDNGILHDEIESPPDHYVAFVKHSATNHLPHLEDSYTHIDHDNNMQLNFLPGKLDFISKPPDVVLPLADMNQSADNRPAVIILNEEMKKSTDNIHNIDGITFGFDINEQLLNGDVSSDSSGDTAPESDSKGDATPEESTTLETFKTSSSGKIIYNSNIEFPSINELALSRATSDGRRSSGEGDSVEGAGEEDVQVGPVKALRYVAPTGGPKDSYNLEKIVHYVGMAWEDTIKSPGGKVRYFSEQQ